MPAIATAGPAGPASTYNKRHHVRGALCKIKDYPAIAVPPVAVGILAAGGAGQPAPFHARRESGAVSSAPSTTSAANAAMVPKTNPPPRRRRVAR